MCDQSFNIFHWRHACNSCRKVICSECFGLRQSSYQAIIAKAYHTYSYNYLCVDCYEKKATPDDYRFLNSLLSYQKVETFPTSYRGNHDLHGDDRQKLGSQGYKFRDLALNELKIQAYFFGFDIVYDVEWTKQKHKTQGTSKNGVYIYSTWSCTGLGARLKTPVEAVRHDLNPEPPKATKTPTHSSNARGKDSKGQHLEASFENISLPTLSELKDDTLPSSKDDSTGELKQNYTVSDILKISGVSIDQLEKTIENYSSMDKAAKEPFDYRAFQMILRFLPLPRVQDLQTRKMRQKQIHELISLHQRSIYSIRPSDL